MILIVVSPDSPFPCFVVGLRVGTWIPTPHVFKAQFAPGIRRSHQGALQIAGREDQGTNKMGDVGRV